MDGRNREELEREIARLQAEVKFKDGLIWTSRVSALYAATFEAELRASKLEAENKELRRAILNQCGDDLCWVKDSGEVKALPETEFLESCRRFRAQVVDHDGEAIGLKTIAQLEAELAGYKESLRLCQDHLPSVWEGDGTCVLCEAIQTHVELQTLKAKANE